MGRIHKVGSGVLASGNAALTSSYVTFGGVICCAGYDQLVLYVDHTHGDETSFDFKTQFSDTADFTDPFEKSYLDTSAAGVSTVLPHTYTMISSGKRIIMIDISMPYFRFQAKATAGTPTGTFNARYRLDNNER